MKTSKMMGVLLGALTVMVGCAAAPGDGTNAAGQAEEVGSFPDQDEADFVVVDRMGRPEMTNLTIGMSMKEIEASKVMESEGLKAEMAAKSVVVGPHIRAYNKQNVFHPKPGEREHAKRLLGAGIRATDVVMQPLPLLHRDPQDWLPSEIEIVADILSEDALVVDISKPCTNDTQSFFDIEHEEFLRRGGKSTDKRDSSGTAAHTTCGGRTLHDDIIDDALTMFVNKSFDFQDPSSPRRVTDKLERGQPFISDGENTDQFPYIGEPHKAYAK